MLLYDFHNFVLIASIKTAIKSVITGLVHTKSTYAHTNESIDYLVFMLNKIFGLFLKGFVYLNFLIRRPRIWKPKLMEHCFYSEILDRWMTIVVSSSVLKQIESLGGLDLYILAVILKLT